MKSSWISVGLLSMGAALLATKVPPVGAHGFDPSADTSVTGVAGGGGSAANRAIADPHDPGAARAAAVSDADASLAASGDSDAHAAAASYAGIGASSRDAWDAVASLGDACSSGDARSRDRAEDRLRELLRADPECARACLDWITTRGALEDATRLALLGVLARETDMPFQMELAQALARMERESAAAFPSDRREVLALLSDLDDPNGVLATLEALPDAWSRDPEVMDVLVRLARDAGDPEIRSYALFRLQAGGGEREARFLLDRIAAETRPEVRRAAVRALSSLPTLEGGDVLLGLFMDRLESPAIRSFAVTGLARHAELPGATEALVHGLEVTGNPNLRSRILAALGEHAVTRVEASETLLEALAGEGDPDGRWSMAEALGRATPPPGGARRAADLLALETDERVRASLEEVVAHWEGRSR